MHRKGYREKNGHGKTNIEEEKSNDQFAIFNQSMVSLDKDRHIKTSRSLTMTDVKALGTEFGDMAWSWFLKDQ